MKRLTVLLASIIVSAGCSTVNQPEAPLSNPAIGSMERLDPALDQLVPKDAAIEKLAGGFTFTEGPLWRAQEKAL
jgi:gluconolactonase